jgi:hypothetical protein
MIEERLKQALKDADTNGGALDVDQIAWLIGAFPGYTGERLKRLCEGCPRIEKLLPEMTPQPSDTQALLRVSHYMNDEDTVGNVADLIRRLIRP